MLGWALNLGFSGGVGNVAADARTAVLGAHRRGDVVGPSEQATPVRPAAREAAAGTSRRDREVAATTTTHTP